MRKILVAVVTGVLVGLGSSVYADGITVGGQVLLGSGAPLADARLQLVERVGEMEQARRLLLDEAVEPTVRSVTDEEGRFRIVAPGAGLWTLIASAPGYAVQEYDLVPLIGSRELPPVTLEPDVGLTVRVDGPGGKVAGATVTVRMDRTLFGSTGWNAPIRLARTDETGTARLPRGEGERFAVSASAPSGTHAERRGLRGGNVRVSLGEGRTQTLAVRAEDGSPVSGALVALGQRAHPIAMTDEEGNAVVTLPGEGSSTLLVLASSDRWLESGLALRTDDKPVSITLPDRREVVGKLIDAETGRPIEGGIVWDREGDGTATDRAGAFSLAGPDGHRMRLAAGAPGYLQARSVNFRLTDDGRAGPTFAVSPAVYVEGRVVDSDGDPIAGADLSVERRRTPGRMEIEFGDGPDLPRSISDPHGRFRVGPLDPDQAWTLRAQAEGYAAGEAAAAGLDPRAPSEPIEVKLERGGIVSGRVADAEGVPLRDAEVELKRAATRTMGMMRMMEGGGGADLPAAVTDADGRFTIRGVPDGKFDLTAGRRGFAETTVAGVDVASGAEPVDLGTVTLQPGERVEGYVTDADGAPLQGVEITVESGGGGMSFMSFGAGPSSSEEPDAVTDPTGWFAVDDLAVGERYTLSYRRTGYVNRSSKGIEPPRIEPLEVAMEAASKVAGVVLDPNGDPIAGATVNMERSVTREMGGAMMQMVMMMDSTADGEGRFEFEDQEPGTMSLMALASGYQETTLSNLEIPKGKDLDGLELKLEPGGIIEGRVLTPDGRPAIGARVNVVTEGDSMMPGMMGGMETDGDGRYRLEGLVPGTVSIEAKHEDYPRRVRDVEATVGINELDLQFAGGVQVTGRVTDETGKPVAASVVSFVPAARGWGGPETRTGTDGRFTMPGVQDGEYRLRAIAEGFAPTQEETPFVVEGQPIDGVAVRLERGVTLVGSISGIEPEMFSRVNVHAAGAHWGGFEGTPVSYKGDYRIEHLAPGDYEVIARVSDSGRKAGEKLTVESGAGEIRLDLRFEPALTLKGVATQGDEPIAGATIMAEGNDVDHTGWGETAQDGAFSIDGLKPGRYDLRLRNWQTGLAHNQTVDLATSRSVEVRVPTARIEGRIVDSSDRRPLQGVSLTLEVENEDNPSRLPTHTAVTDQEGRFVIDAVADGRWRLAATRPGYATDTRTVAVEQGRSSTSLDLEMEPTEGLTLSVSTPGGGFPDDVRVAVIDASGYAVTHGVYATGENGRLRLSSVRAGDWRVALSAAGWATTNIDASAPGSSVAVTLEPATQMKLIVPDLEESGQVAWVTLTDDSGKSYHTLGWTGRPDSRWRMADGEMQFLSLPPGRWNVRVESSDGRSWEGRLETSPGAPGELRMEG